MPINPNYKSPEEKPLELLPPNYYQAVIEDIEAEVKDFGFKNPDGSPQEPTHQLVVRLKVTDGEFAGRKLICWIKDSLFPQTKSKNPTLPKFLKAVTGKPYTVSNRAEVSPEFMNSLIGRGVRVSTDNVENKKGQEQTRVIAFAPLPTTKTGGEPDLAQPEAPTAAGTNDEPLPFE